MNNNAIILPTTLHQSPDYWQNFIRHYKDNIMKIEDSIDRGLYVNYILYSSWFLWFWSVMWNWSFVFDICNIYSF